MKSILRAVSPLIILSGLLVANRSFAHSGDRTFLDHIHEAGLAKMALTKTAAGADRSVVVKQMADLFPLAKNDLGQQLMPDGTVCDSVEFDGSIMTVRFTFPADVDVAAFAPNWSDSIGMVLRHYFGFDYELTEIKVEGRRDSAAKSAAGYVPLSDFIPQVPVPGDEPGADPERLAILKAAQDAEIKSVRAKVESGVIENPATKNFPGQGPAAVGSQPTGVLSGRVVYLGAGHGLTYTGGSSWVLLRPLLQNMNEDYANQDALTFTAYELFNAGATVVPTRPIGFQPNEVVLDNTSADVTFTGTWTAGATNTDNYGNSSGNTMQSVSTAATQSATATFAPSIPVAGWYPVYAFANYGADRTSAQLYKVIHSGGESRITINHQRVGRGWVWLGTYYFSAGKNASIGSVVVSNELQSGATAGLVIADAIRFGNGMGATNRGGGISGRRSESEANIYWANKAEAPEAVCFPGAPSDTPHVPGGTSRMAAYMNADTNNYNSQIYLGYHSNADSGTGTARGSEGLITNVATVTNQPAFAALLSNTLDEQATVEAGNWEHTWGTRGPTFTGAYPEIGQFGGEMCGSMIEVGFHTNTQDAQLMRDPKVRAVVARTQTHAIIKYFNQFGGGALAFPPLQPQRVRAVNNGSGGATVSWAAVAAASPTVLASQAATGYRVYRSTDGLNFGNPVVVSGNGTTSANVTGLTANQITYFRVAAVNGAGESPASEVLAVRVMSGTPTVLIVNGYDRIDRFNNIPDSEQLPNIVEKIRPRQNNSYDYVRQHGQALAAAGKWFDSCSNEAIINNDINLATYQTVVWIGGEESTADKTFDATERTAIQNFTAIAGKNLFVSGSEIGAELVGAAVAPTFYQNTLRASYVADSSGRTTAIGVAGSIFAGITVDFAQTPDTYNVTAPDVIGTSGGSVAAMGYDATTTTLDGLNAIGLWQDPNFSGSTNADAACTFNIVTTPLQEGTGSGRLNYVWGTGTLIRERAANPNASLPTFNADSDFGIWIFGDNSGNQFRISFRDPVDGELYAKPYTTINWTGWRLHMIPDVKNNLGSVWAAGVNNVLNGPTVQLDSILVLKGASSPASGSLYFDGLSLRLRGASSQTAAIQYSGTYKAVTFGFPFEAIGSQSQQNQVMSAAMTFFGASALDSGIADWQLY